MAEKKLDFLELKEYKICISSQSEILDFLAQEAAKNKKNRIVTLNPEFIALAERKEVFKKALLAAEILIPDGIGLVFLLRLKNLFLASKNKKKIERIPGIELAFNLLSKLFDSKKQTIGFLGGKPEALTKTIDFFQKQKLIEQANVVFRSHGYFQEETKLIAEILEKQPNFLFIALPFERQEELIEKLYQDQKRNYGKNARLENLITIGLGGSFDVWSSQKKRAPKIWRKLNLEWLWRLIVEPSRLKRLLQMLLFFSFFCCKCLLSERTRETNKTSQEQ